MAKPKIKSGIKTGHNLKFKPNAPVVGAKFNAVKKGANTKPGATDLAAHRTGGMPGATVPAKPSPYGG